MGGVHAGRTWSKNAGWRGTFLIASLPPARRRSATRPSRHGEPAGPEGISTAGKYAVQLKRPTTGDRYDYFLGMDQWNIRNMKRILGDPENKVHLLLDFTGRRGGDRDPGHGRL